MTCQDCETYLALDERNAAVEEHLGECAECRALSQDLRANELVLASLQNEELPRVVVKISRRRQGYPWLVAAAAALFAFALLGPRTRPTNTAKPPIAPQVVVEQPAQPQPTETAKAEPPRLRLRPRQKTEPLKIKMLTSDPDVVIYWLIED